MSLSSLTLEEDGSIRSGEVCVVKRNGDIPAGGLTVEFAFLSVGGDTTLASKTPISDSVSFLI